MSETINLSVPQNNSPMDSADPIDQLALLAAEAADDRKAGDIVLIKVGEVSPITEYFVMATGYSKVQVRAIANAIEDKIKETLDRKPLRNEGLSEGLWACLDYGDVVVHVQMPSEREYYGLEAFWGHAERIPFVPKAA
ncbi:ribosome silencing factor [Alkalinema sp. FACHB-956]|uniref:ribosome silencing factor n=1 Tax=Alkalinema sp. FACHB-956 TaxID=2692768 RepID=UPI001683D227|nr:ribosome silencing factor [Alkalinema sp. FACHB-956]MBD2329161.1 ribosome silencing factor [Alkalinema sp. FACHB-956]